MHPLMKKREKRGGVQLEAKMELGIKRGQVDANFRRHRGGYKKLAGSLSLSLVSQPFFFKYYPSEEEEEED